VVCSHAPRCLQGLNDCTDLEYLDLSFNVIERVENVAHLTKLQGIANWRAEFEENAITSPQQPTRPELYLIENKLSELPEPDQFANRLTSLEMLELGGNRFRSLGALHLPVLTKLWVGKNKLTSLRDVNLPHLRLLSMQSNRFVSFRELPALEHLEELYLSHNGLETLADMPPSIVRTLQMLDVGTNRVTSLAALPAFPALREFWFNNNKIATFEELTHVVSMCGSTLEAIYAEGNPFADTTQYRPKMALLFEQLGELDGMPLVRPSWARAPGEPITASDLSKHNGDDDDDD
jgi:protein phosphatase 1 regulatory subunit 7